MKCANPKCKHPYEMQADFIKVTRPGKRTKYYCSQRCYNKVHPRPKEVFTLETEKEINWKKVYEGGW